MMVNDQKASVGLTSTRGHFCAAGSFTESFLIDLM